VDSSKGNRRESIIIGVQRIPQQQAAKLFWKSRQATIETGGFPQAILVFAARGPGKEKEKQD
jgi:hypothetical protein